MKILQPILHIALITLTAAGCISFRVMEPELPENQVTSMLFCSEVDESGTLLNPVNPKSEFNREAELVHCFVKMEDISGEVRLKWKWYSPDKQLRRETQEIIINQNRVYIKALTAYDTYYFKTDSLPILKGEWTAALFLNGDFITSRNFSISD